MGDASQHNGRRHPRKRVIQYAETSMVNTDRFGLLDTPHARGTTSGVLANAIFLLFLLARDVVSPR
jgi:hypothetical protein